MQGIKHHLIDCVDPNDPFDAHRFCTYAQQAIEEIRHRNKHVILCGGTGFYLKSLLKTRI